LDRVIVVKVRYTTKAACPIKAAFPRYKVVKAAAGKQHTVVVTEDGSSFAFGSNKNGQLGTGSLKSGEHPVVHLESLLSACCSSAG
jgi:alpha-tubulin suppressor-like RCC1 family protein